MAGRTKIERETRRPVKTRTIDLSPSVAEQLRRFELKNCGHGSMAPKNKRLLSNGRRLKWVLGLGLNQRSSGYERQ